jgi:TetR/AcrR family transcriptional regulator, mexJK operon transcriptional repressor
MAARKRNNPARKPMLPALVRMRLEDDRVAQILDIAAEAFISQGFEGASVNEIAQRANASKTTLYSRFPTKQELFIAVLERRMNFVFNEVATALPVDAPIESTLTDFGSRLLELALSGDQVALLRVVGMESKRFPELGKRFYELGPKRGIAHLGRYLREQIKRGLLIEEDSTIMAEHLSSLLTGGPVRWVVLGLRSSLGAKDRQKRIDSAVRVFLRAYSVHRPAK